MKSALIRRKGKLFELIGCLKKLLCVALLDPLVIATTKPHLHEKRVLIIRLDAIGDFVLWLDAAKELINSYQRRGYNVTVMANETWAGWLESFGYADAVWGVNRQKLLLDPVYRWKLLRQIRVSGFEVALYPTFSRELLLGDTIIRVSAALQRIGSQGDCTNIRHWQKNISDHWYTKLAPASDAPRMELERNAEFMQGLGFSSYRAQIAAIPVPLSTIDEIQPDRPYCIIFPGASWVGRQWSAENYAALLSALQQHAGWLPVLCGGPDERELCETIVTAAGSPALNLAGKTSLTQLTELIRSAGLLVGNETSAIHIAAAVATPAVCILGGGHYGRFIPYPYDIVADDNRPLPLPVIHRMECYGCNWQCKFPVKDGEPVPCIANITVDNVWQSVVNLLRSFSELRV